MNLRSWNWPTWSGLAVTVFAFISYPMLFARWPVTRDWPWVNLILFAIALALLYIGFRRASRKVVPVISTLAGTTIFFLFVVSVFVLFKQMPAATNAPRVGSRAPDFTLLDTSRRPVSLTQLVASSPRGVLLIFYRGYW